MASAQDVANWFLRAIDREAGEVISPLKLQKLLYYGQAWHLAIHDEALFDEEFQAWAHGPVVPGIYHEYKSLRWDAIPRPENEPELEDKEVETLEMVLEAYGGLSAKQLERLTHSEAPWQSARGDLPPEASSNAVIPKKQMLEFYAALLEENHEDGEEE